MRSSTATTIHELDDKHVPTSSATTCNVSLQSQSLNQWEEDLRNDEKEFKRLIQISKHPRRWKRLSEKKNLVIEKNKFNIMKRVYDSIIEQYGPSNQNEVEVIVKATKTALWRKALFVFLITINITISLIGGFIGTIELVEALIPKIAPLITMFISAIASVIEGIMIYSLFKGFLQKGLGIEPETTQDTLADAYNKRLELMKKINSLMINNTHYTGKKSVAVYRSYKNILTIFNQDMSSIKLLDYAESTANKIVRYCLTIINTGFHIAGTYFASTRLLTTVGAASLLGTPIGWSIIVAIITIQLITIFLTRQGSVYDFLNPYAAQHETIKEKLIKFKNKSEGISERINEDLFILQNLTERRERKSSDLLRSSTPTTLHRLPGLRPISTVRPGLFPDRFRHPEEGGHAALCPPYTSREGVGWAKRSVPTLTP